MNNYFTQETYDHDTKKSSVTVMEVMPIGKGKAVEVVELKGLTLSLSDAMKVTAALNRADYRGWTEHKACVIQLTNKRRDDLCPR